MKKKNCNWCGADVHPKRWALGFHTCLVCGDEQARREREDWCVVQEYGKGAYQFVTASAAKVTLRETNQKNPR